jgi:hypothetical protein
MDYLSFREVNDYRGEVRVLLAERDTLQAGGYTQLRRLGRQFTNEEIARRVAEIAGRLAFIKDDIDQRSYRVNGDGIRFTSGG